MKAATPIIENYTVQLYISVSLINIFIVYR